MKKILYIGRYNGIIGGIERYMQKSAALLRRSGFAVHYLYTEDGGREQADFAAAFDSVQIFAPENELLKTADLVIIHNIIGVEFLSFMPADKTFFFAHDHNIYCQRHHYYWPVGRINCHRKRQKAVCQLCSLGREPAPPLAEYRRFPALVLSDFMKDNLLKNGFEKVVKLPAFIQTAEQERSFMPEGVLRILFLGQLIRGKGADLMLKTLARLDIPFVCTIAGEGNDRPMLEKMVEKFDLSDKVHFTGFIREPEKLWQNCDVFFFPIRWQEPFGLVGLEALAHGIPVVAFDLGGVREWLVNGKNGFAVPEGADAVPALKLLAAHPEDFFGRMSRFAVTFAQEHFSEENFMKEFEKLCEGMK
ncbi:MAG: glycosyltransferase family 4 protein [Lentisphaeria bacterium]|nr:glycosyltransferase family 4 protein [Lentisphaeria bacterium]